MTTLPFLFPAHARDDLARCAARRLVIDPSCR
jgi:hypothetical protein